MTGEPAYGIDFFRPGDAAGIVALFHAVYGENYPAGGVYNPEEILRQEECHETYRMVARSPEGEVIGQIAVYRSAPQNEKLYEIGQLVIRHDWRQHNIAFKLIHACTTGIPREHHIGLWGEAVCNHPFLQKMMVREGFIETALAIDLMPESAYSLPTSQPGGGRVSTVVSFLPYSFQLRTLYVPGIYTDFFRFIYDAADPGHTFAVSRAGLPSGIATTGTMEIIPSAGVARISVPFAGADFTQWIGDKAAEAARSGVVVTQVFLPLTLPWTGAIVEVLRKRGFFVGGPLFQWFGDDGLLMQEMSPAPDFERPALFTQRAMKIRDYVRDDWKAVNGMRSTFTVNEGIAGDVKTSRRQK